MLLSLTFRRAMQQENDSCRQNPLRWEECKGQQEKLQHGR